MTRKVGRYRSDFKELAALRDEEGRELIKELAALRDEEGKARS